MRPKILSKHEELDLTRSFHDMFQRNRKTSQAQLWYDSVNQFLNWKYEGSSIIARTVREMENKVLQHDHLCQEYVSALMKICLPDDGKALTEHQKMVLIMTASSDEREEALLLIQS